MSRVGRPGADGFQRAGLAVGLRRGCRQEEGARRYLQRKRDALSRSAQVAAWGHPRPTDRRGGELGEIPQRAPARGAGHARTLSGGSARRRARRANRRILGLTAACGVESYVGTALPRPRIGLDDTSSRSATARSRPPRSSASPSRSTARAGFSRSLTPRAPTSGRLSGCRSTRSCIGTAGELIPHSAPANPCCRHAS